MRTAVLSDSDRAFNLFRSERARRQVRQPGVKPFRITSLAAHAVMTGDKFLAAEIMSLLHRLRKGEQGLAFLLRQELENVIVSDSRAQDAIAIARTRARNVAGAA